MTDRAGSRWVDRLESLGFGLATSGLFARVLISATTASPNQRNLVLLLWFSGAAFLALSAALSHQKAALLRSPFGLAALFVAAVVALQGPYEAEAAQAWLERVGMILLAVFLPAALADPRRRAQLLASTLGAVALACLLGLVQRWYLFDQLRAAAGDLNADPSMTAFLQSDRARATFGQANALATAIAMSLPFAVVWWLGESNRRARGRAVFFAAIMIGALLASESRGGAWACVCGVGALALLGRWRVEAGLANLTLRLCAALAGAGFIAWMAVMTGLWDVGGSGFLQTLDFRRDYASMAWRAWLDEPWSGHGFTLLGEVAEDYREKGEAFSRLAHNGYLSTLAELGLCGAAALILFAASLLRRHETTDAAIPAGTPWGLWWPLAGGLLISAWSGDLLFFVGSDGEGHRTLNGLLVILSGCGLVWALGLPAAKALLSRPDALRAATLAAGVAFLAHGLVDTNFYNPNLLALLVLTQIVAQSGRRPAPGSPIMGCLVAGGILVLALGWLQISAPYVRSSPLLAQERAAQGRPLPTKLRARITEEALHAAEHRPLHLESLRRALDALSMSRNVDAIQYAYRLADSHRPLLERLFDYRRRLEALTWVMRNMSLPDVAQNAAFFEEFEDRYRHGGRND